jgi:hypothetical protein
LNSRSPCEDARFPSVCTRPLCDLSMLILSNNRSFLQVSLRMLEIVFSFVSYFFLRITFTVNQNPGLIRAGRFCVPIIMLFNSIGKISSNPNIKPLLFKALQKVNLIHRSTHRLFEAYTSKNEISTRST